MKKKSSVYGNQTQNLKKIYKLKKKKMGKYFLDNQYKITNAFFSFECYCSRNKNP